MRRYKCSAAAAALTALFALVPPPAHAQMIPDGPFPTAAPEGFDNLGGCSEETPCDLNVTGFVHHRSTMSLFAGGTGNTHLALDASRITFAPGLQAILFDASIGFDALRLSLQRDSSELLFNAYNDGKKFNFFGGPDAFKDGVGASVQFASSGQRPVKFFLGTDFIRSAFYMPMTEDSVDRLQANMLTLSAGIMFMVNDSTGIAISMLNFGLQQSLAAASPEVPLDDLHVNVKPGTEFRGSVSFDLSRQWILTASALMEAGRFMLMSELEKNTLFALGQSTSLGFEASVRSTPAMARFNADVSPCLVIGGNMKLLVTLGLVGAKLVNQAALPADPRAPGEEPAEGFEESMLFTRLGVGLSADF